MLTGVSLARSVVFSVRLSSSFFSRQEIFSSLIFNVCWTVSSSRDSSSLYLLPCRQNKSAHQLPIRQCVCSITVIRSAGLAWQLSCRVLEQTTCPPGCALAVIVFLCGARFSPALDRVALTRRSVAERSASRTPTPTRTHGRRHAGTHAHAHTDRHMSYSQETRTH